MFWCMHLSVKLLSPILVRIQIARFLGDYFAMHMHVVFEFLVAVVIVRKPGLFCSCILGRVEIQIATSHDAGIFHRSSPLF